MPPSRTEVHLQTHGELLRILSRPLHPHHPTECRHSSTPKAYPNGVAQGIAAMISWPWGLLAGLGLGSEARPWKCVGRTLAHTRTYALGSAAAWARAAFLGIFGAPPRRVNLAA